MTMPSKLQMNVTQLSARENFIECGSYIRISTNASSSITKELNIKLILNQVIALHITLTLNNRSHCSAKY